MANNSNGILFANSTALDTNVRIVKSKRKEDALNASNQIPYGGIIVIVKYGSTRYIKITDGAKKFSEIAKDGEGDEGGSVAWDDIADKPTIFPPIVGTGADQAMAGNTELLEIGTTATTAKAGNYVPTWAEVTSKPTFGTASAADVGDFATSAQGGLADTAVQPADIPQEVQDWLLTLTGGTTAGNVLAVNSTGNGFEFITPA